MRSKSAEKVKLTSFDELFGTSSDDAKSSGEQIIYVPLDQLHSFKGHPFQVKDDEKMLEMVESVKKYGVLNPGIVRTDPDGGYEVIAGHRRRRASELAELTEMPVILRELSDDEATIIMVDSNIQRENILPSEKAFAYKMKQEAMRHQGVKGGEEETAALVGKETGDSGRTVQRYIRLTELLSELLELVDSQKLKFIPAVAISYLTKEEQKWVLKYITQKGAAVSGPIAQQLKKYSADGSLTEIVVQQLLCGEKKGSQKVTLSEKRIKEYFPKDYSRQQMEQIIYELLDEWKSRQ